MGLDIINMLTATYEEDVLRNKGRESFLAGDYVKAAKYYRKTIKITKTQDPNDSSLIPTFIGLCECYIRLNEWEKAKTIAEQLMSLVKEYEDQEGIRVTVELVDEIEQVIFDMDKYYDLRTYKKKFIIIINVY